MAPQDFQNLLATKPPIEIAKEILLAPGAEKVNEEQINLVAAALAGAYNLSAEELSIIIVGSAKLGFSLVEKRDETGIVLPRYRPFNEASDIDIAVVSERLYNLLWSELVYFAHSQPRMPWVHKNLANYMLYGWLRPDHFPPNHLFSSGRIWWDKFREFGLKQFPFRRVRGGLFLSSWHLAVYQERTVRLCL